VLIREIARSEWATGAIIGAGSRIDDEVRIHIERFGRRCYNQWRLEVPREHQFVGKSRQQKREAIPS
jgi:hypothetical protein